MPQVRAREAIQFLMAARQCEIESLKHLLEAGRLVLAVSGLVHCLQRERGASNLFLGSGGSVTGNSWSNTRTRPGRRRRSCASA